jgi:hypothetical protein
MTQYPEKVTKGKKKTQSSLWEFPTKRRINATIGERRFSRVLLQGAFLSFWSVKPCFLYLHSFFLPYVPL